MTKRSEPRDHRMVVRIPTSLWLELKGVAKEDERTVSDWIFVTLQDALAKRRGGRASAAAASGDPPPPLARSKPGPSTKRLPPKKLASKKKP